MFLKVEKRFKQYYFNPVLFQHDQFLTLTPSNINKLCADGAKFQIIPAKYPLSVVFMSQFDRKWIRFGENEVINTKFRFKREFTDGEKQFWHIESVASPGYYLTMGFRGWWLRAKYHHNRITDAAAYWDIRCLKTNDDKGNILFKYMLVPKNSHLFVCVDRTNRLKGCDDNLDESKMFMFKQTL